MLYTYCLFNSNSLAFSLPEGFMGNLEIIQEGAIAAVVEIGLPQKELETDDEKLVQAVIHHDWVICEIFRSTTVLPLRFGTYFKQTEDLKQHLATNQEKYSQQLQQIVGKVELTLKLTPIPFSPDKETTQATKGSTYLKAKKQSYQEQTAYQNQQQETLTEFQGEMKKKYPQFIQGEPKEGTERFYLLLDSTNLSTFWEQIQQWKQQLKTWEIEVSDPLPPYHFL
ncbi:MAG: GvpL/GvpF family gas vesicle protein [Halothece sp.]